MFAKGIEMRPIVLACALALAFTNAGESLAQSKANDVIQALVDKGEDEAAFNAASEAAERGDTRAMEWLGWFYEEGVSVETNIDLAIRHYRAALAGGHNHSRWRIGVLIDTGKAEGTLEEAVELFTMAAEDGHTDALTSLAVMQATGRGTPLDYEASLASYMQAARAGNPHGVQGVGVLFALGQGVEKDIEEAAAWFLVSAFAGNETGATNFDLAAEGMHPVRLAFVIKRAQAIADELEYDLRIDDSSKQ